VTITLQAVFSGLVSGLIYAVLAAGFVLVYRSTGVLNFAQGEIGAFGVALFALLNAGYGVPYWLAFGLAVAACALIGLIIEMTVVRRLFHSPRLVLLIATIGVGQLLLVARLALPDTAAAATFPLPFSGIWHPTGSLVVFSRDVLVLIVAPISIVALALFMTRTKLGLLVRASASNPDTARLYGISVKRTSTIVWTLAGGFAGLTAIMIAPIQGITPGSIVRAGAEAIGPALLLRALVVGLIARLRSLPMTIVGGLAVGLFEAIVLANVDSAKRSIVDLYLFLGTLVLVLFVHRGRRAEESWSLAARVKPLPERLARLWYVRHLAAIGYAVLFGALAVLPLFLTQRSQEFLWTDVVIFAMAALPISLLIGWAGQVSLGQFAFVGLGGLTMVVLTQGLDIPVPFALFTMNAHLPWAVAVALSTTVGVVAAVIVGVPALRVRGLLLAVITFAFGVAATSWLFGQAVFTGGQFSSTTPPTTPPVLGPIDFADRRTFYYLCLSCLFILTVMVARLRRTGVGRSMIAVRDNEEMAAASTVSSRRVRLVAFALSGGMAAFAGCLFVTLRSQVNPTATFTSDGSLQLVATAIIGGLGSVTGPVLGALFVRGLPVLFGDVQQVQLLTSGIGLLVLLMYFPGGLMQIVYSLRDVVLGWAEQRLPRPAAPPLPAVPARTVRSDRERAAVVADGASLSVRGVSVRFGGNRAVDNVSISVRPDELVGLIGTNGAGKSTLLNAICGFVPSTGAIDVLGRDVSGLPAHRRHRAGLGRGFQSARLYPNLTVRDSLMVALEAREHSWLLPSMTGLPPSRAAERRKRSDAEELVSFLGLGRYADEFVANLSTGTRRIVELASLFAVDAKVLLLDEPTGGLAQRETEAFAPLIVRVRRELGAAMIVIEHDMALIMSISDRVYCLEAGRVIAEGTPLEVRNDPLVVASYLGTEAPLPPR
jgi:ABC-type branched-subunit amino acid transport system ATPase component/ABC-type branched-subunit amino acid transport system permease subunit